MFVYGHKAKWALTPETKLHIQKYGESEHIEKQSSTLEVALGSSTDTNLGHNHNLGISKSDFLEK